MRIHSLHHCPSEGLGEIAAWALGRGHTVTSTWFDRGEVPPLLDQIDWLIIMGGPMNIYEHRKHPWLVMEKKFIADAIAQGKRVLGICLGSQLIADALGGKVFQNAEIEIGWFPIHFQPEAQTHTLFKSVPLSLTPLHWHGDTFSLPPEAVLLASSEGCRNQAFAVGDRVVGLQFHLEVGMDDIAAFLKAEGELGRGRYIQTPEAILAEASKHLSADHSALENLLDAMADSRRHVPVLHHEPARI